MPRNSAVRFTRIAITSALVIYVFHKAGLLSVEGWQDLFDKFAHINLLFLALSIGIGLLIILASAFKWYMLAQSSGLRVTLWRLYIYYLIGIFFNQILPTSIGGDVVRMHELGRYTGRYPDAVASVFVERFSGMVTLVVLALLAIGVNIHLFEHPWVMVVLVLVVGGAVALTCWLSVNERPLQLVQELFVRRIPLLCKVFGKIEKFQKAILVYKNDPGALWWALLNSLVFYFFTILNVWISALALGSNLSFLTMLTAVPIILLIINIPISIGGIGLMEFSYSSILGLFGASPTLAISTVVLMRAKSFLYAALGGLLHFLVINSNSITDKSPAEEASKFNNRF